MKFPQLSTSALLILACLATIPSGMLYAGTYQKQCYHQPGMLKPQKQTVKKALYVFVDQTMDIPAEMKQDILDLVAEWGNHGERVTITRFSANVQGRFAQMVFDAQGNTSPDEGYLYNLRRKHRRQVETCLEKSQDLFREKLRQTLSKTLNEASDKYKKTDLLHSLSVFAEQIIGPDKDINDKTILIISDGLENSKYFSFHRRNVFRHIDPKRMLKKTKKLGLLPDWQGATVYFLGIGHVSDKNFYAHPKIVSPLKKFWETYFKVSNADLRANSFGTPMLVTRSILD